MAGCSTKLLVAIMVAAVALVTLFSLAFRPQLRNRYLGQFASQGDVDREMERSVREFCGACHVVPHPGLLPRASWPEEIPKAFNRYRVSGRKDLRVPDQAAVIAYFSRLAPAAMDIPEAPESFESPVLFRAEGIDLRPADPFAAVSFMGVNRKLLRDGRSASDLLLCDMGSGSLHKFAWSEGQTSDAPLGRLKHPAHVLPCDFDRDGRQDFLVADLGTFKPSDELQGSVVLLRSKGEGRPLEEITVQEGLARVADAQLADLDGDGDFDFVVAEFGFEKVGRLLWLETLSITEGRPTTKLHVMDTRHGTIHAPVTDFDGDGDLDVIALISQEHETIVAFVNDGRGQFEKRVLFEADSPSFGSSGMELADLDGDGDQDLLFTNGDTLDTFQFRPFHAVNWLENRGSGEYLFHQIALLPGAVRAVAGDIDGDGDLDIAAVAFCPPFLRHQIRPRTLDTLIWLEQTAVGQFERHSLERSETGHMAIVAADFDGDSDLDLAVGEFSPFSPQSRRWLTIHWNERRADFAKENSAGTPVRP